MEIPLSFIEKQKKISEDQYKKDFETLRLKKEDILEMIKLSEKDLEKKILNTSIQEIKEALITNELMKLKKITIQDEEVERHAQLQCMINPSLNKDDIKESVRYNLMKERLMRGFIETQ